MTFPDVLLFLQTSQKNQTFAEVANAHRDLASASIANVAAWEHKCPAWRQALLREPHSSLQQGAAATGPGQKDSFGFLLFGLGDSICLLPSLLAALIKSLLSSLLENPPCLTGWRERGELTPRRLRHSTSFDVGSSNGRFCCVVKDTGLCLLFPNAHGHRPQKPIPFPLLEASFKG